MLLGEIKVREKGTISGIGVGGAKELIFFLLNEKMKKKTSRHNIDFLKIDKVRKDCILSTFYNPGTVWV